MDGISRAFAAFALVLILGAGVPIGRSADSPPANPLEWLEFSIGDPRMARWLDLALDGGGRPHFAYVVQGASDAEDVVAYARWHNGAWIREDIVPIGIWDSGALLMRPWGQFLFAHRDPAQGAEALYLARHVWGPPGDWEMMEFVGSTRVLDFAAGRKSAYEAMFAVENGSLTDVRLARPWWSPVALGAFGEFRDLAVAQNETGVTHVLVAAGAMLYDVATENTWWGTWSTNAVYGGLGADAVVRADSGPGGTVHVLVATGPDLLYFEGDGQTWREEIIATDVAGCPTCTIADFYVNRSGVPYVLYETQAGGLRMLDRARGLWEERALPPSVQGRVFSLVVPDGSVHIAFAGSDGALRLATESPLPWVASGVLVLTTDRCVYALGDRVTTTLSNSGNASLGWGGYPPEFWVFNESGGIVFRIWVQLAVAVTLAPGESLNLSWSQRYSLLDENGYPIPPNGEQVPAGRYRILSEAGTGNFVWNEHLVAGATVAIGVPCPGEPSGGDFGFGGGPRGDGADVGP